MSWPCMFLGHEDVDLEGADSMLSVPICRHCLEPAPESMQMPDWKWEKLDPAVAVLLFAVRDLARLVPLPRTLSSARTEYVCAKVEKVMGPLDGSPDTD